jgi:hypothetical protein
MEKKGAWIWPHQLKRVNKRCGMPQPGGHIAAAPLTALWAMHGIKREKVTIILAMPLI